MAFHKWEALNNYEVQLPAVFDGINREYDEAEQKKAEENIWVARNHFVLKAPFFGILSMEMKLVESSKWLKTVATDGRDFYFNTGFLNMLTPIGIQFCFAHCLVHCVYQHFNRMKVPLTTLEKLFPGNDISESDKSKLFKALYSAASDYAVNRDVAKVLLTVHSQHNSNKFSKETDVLISPKILPLYYDNKYKDLATEDILIDLFKEVKAGKNPLENGFTLDDHALMGKMGEGNGQQTSLAPKGDDVYDESYFDGKPRLTDEERERIVEDFQERVFKAFDMYEQSLASGNKGTAGTVPGDIERFIGKLRNPEVNWRQFIQSRLVSKFEDGGESWDNVDRRTFGESFFMPGQKERERIELVFIIDASGSMSEDELADALSELRGITMQYEDYELKVWAFDGEVRHETYKVFTPANIHELVNYRITGGGGTMFLKNWSFMKQENMKPKLIIMFTDGYANDDYGVPGFAETIYLVNSEVVIPQEFGTTIRYRGRDYQG